jgi:hypothetical protein
VVARICLLLLLLLLLLQVQHNLQEKQGSRNAAPENLG